MGGNLNNPNEFSYLSNMKYFIHKPILIFFLSVIFSNCDSSQSSKEEPQNRIIEKPLTNKSSKQEIQNWIAEMLTKYSLPDETSGTQNSKNIVYFKNDSLIKECMFKGGSTSDFTKNILSTKNEYIGETYFEGDSLFYIMYLDRPMAGMRLKGNYSAEKKLPERLIKSFDMLKSFYKKDRLEENEIVNEREKNIEIIGEWIGIDKTGMKSTLILDKTNHATLVSNNQVLGEGERDGIKFECKYDFDYTKTPMWLDILLIHKESQKELLRIKGIVRFITDTKIEFRVSFNGRRRFNNFDFNDKENTMVLDKVAN